VKDRKRGERGGGEREDLPLFYSLLLDPFVFLELWFQVSPVKGKLVIEREDGDEREEREREERPASLLVCLARPFRILRGVVPRN
jgi:hypothetical protein